MTEKRKSVGVLSTGGTISMQKTPRGYAPIPGYLEKAMANIPELHNQDMPAYVIYEDERPMDSANMTPHDWYRMGHFIKEHYAEHDGFVILHGTDTMAYTASALSFMLENLGKPVILTGSQLPLFATRNDARENLMNALFIAGQYPIPEVCIYFNNKLFRGNRSKKVDAANFAAFSSPNFPILGKVGTDVSIRYELLRTAPRENVELHKMNPVIINTLRIFPGVSPEMMRHFLESPLQALILETYGVGTAPEHPEFIDVLQRLAKREIIIVNCSQCAHAKVKMNDYAVGEALLKAGVVSGGDMTVEAIITKLFYLLSRNLSLNEVKKQLAINLRGELTVV